MGVALMVVPGIALAWMWSRWARLAGAEAFRQLLAGGPRWSVVGRAWPLLVTLTPAADRPWISGTSDNSIWSLIFGYNGLGRVAGQSGGPGGAGGGWRRSGGFGGTVRRRHRPVPAAAVGPRRSGRLAARVRGGRRARAGRGLAAAPARPAHRLADRGRRRVSDHRARVQLRVGIFHPYYVSFLAPFAAALVGAGAGMMLGSPRARRPRRPRDRAAGDRRRRDHRAGRARRARRGAAVGGAARDRGRRRVCRPARDRRPRGRPRGPRRGRARRAAGGAGGVGGRDARSRHQRDLPGGRAGERVDRWPRWWWRWRSAASAAAWRGGPAARGSGGRLGAAAPRRVAAVPAVRAPAGAGGRRPAAAASAAVRGGFRRRQASSTAAVKYANAHGGGTIGVESQSSAAPRS